MTDTTTNARIRTIENDVTAQYIAEQTHIFYDPSTGLGTYSFQGRENLFVGTCWQPLTGNWDTLTGNIGDIASDCFGTGADPVTGADLTKISVAGLSIILKGAYDTLFNQRAAAEAAAAAPTPTPAPAPAPASN